MGTVLGKFLFGTLFGNVTKSEDPDDVYIVHQGDGALIEEGAVIVLNPTATLGQHVDIVETEPGGWETRTVSKQPASYWGCTVAATADGSRILTPLS